MKSMLTDDFNTQNDAVCDFYVSALEKLFDKCKNVLISGNDSGINTVIVREYIRKNSYKYKNVIYVRYDREKYVITPRSIDSVLKKALSSHFIKDNKICGNYLDEFEKSLCDNSLVVIDNYNVASISPYMRHIASSDASFVVVSECEMKTLPDNFEALNANVSDTDDAFIQKIKALSCTEKELLMTLCAMLKYLGTNTKIYSSNEGVFNRQSMQYYLGALSEHFDALKNFGLADESKSGKISISKNVSEYVMSELCPDAVNCKTLMEFFERNTDFYIFQDTKDLLAKFYISNSADISLVGSAELFDIYTHFCRTDENAGLRLYNMFMSLILQRITAGKTEHLLMNNKHCFLELLCKELKGELAEKIYDDDNYLEDECPASYSLSVRANLDIIRICVCLVRGMTADLYRENEAILKTLFNAMTDLFDEICRSDADDYEKSLMLDDCIRICNETFSYFSVLDGKGIYNRKRDDMNSSAVSYLGERNCDRKSASSIVMGYSELTLSLYAVFQRYLYEWSKLCDKEDIKFGNRLLDAVHREKLIERRELFEQISFHYCRIREGFENFSDFFEAKKKNVCVWEEVFDENLLNHIHFNKHLLMRGFDRGIKTEAEKYAVKVVSAIRNSRNPAPLIRMLLSRDYPLSDECYRMLLDKKLVTLVADNRDMTDKTKSELVLCLVDNYNEYSEKKWKNRLIKEIIAALYIKIPSTEAFEQRFYGCVSSMYLVNKTFNIFEKQTFPDILYEKSLKKHPQSNTGSCEYVAKALYEYLTFGKIPENQRKLINALDAVYFEYNTANTMLDLAGFLKIAEILTDGNLVVEDIDE